MINIVLEFKLVKLYLVHINGVSLVCHDLVEEELFLSSSDIIIRSLLEGAVDKFLKMRSSTLEQLDWWSIDYLDKSYVIFIEAVTLEERHEVVFLDDELKDINGALLVEPLVTVPRLPHKVLPQMTESITYYRTVP